MTADLHRILIVLQSTTIGGMETHAIDLAAELANRNIDIRVVVPEGPTFDALERRLLERTIPVTRLDTDARRGRMGQVKRWFQLLALCRGFKPDAIHLHTGGTTGGLAALLAARLTARSVVLTEHDVPVSARVGLRGRLIKRASDTLCTAIVAVSRRNAQERAARIGFESPKQVSVLNGVPSSQVTSEARSRNRVAIRSQYCIPADALVYGSVVRLAPGKGLDDLVEATHKLVGVPGWHLLLVGDGPLRVELENRVRERQLEGRVHFTSTQTEPERFLDAMDVFVLPVPEGSMSIALLEAMARGLPSIISFCGPEEAVVDGRTGLCAPPRDPSGLASAMLRLAQDENFRRRLGRAGSRYVRTRFSIRRVTEDLLTVYGTTKPDAIPNRLRP